MSNLLHVSANIYKGINKADHNYKIWSELAKGFDDYYLFARSNRNKFETFKEDNITLILIPKIVTPSRIFIFSSFLIFFYIQKFKITHILCQSAIFGGTASLLAKKIYGIPVMVEIHGEEYFRLMNSKRLYLKPIGRFLIFIYKKANKVRSLNPFMTQKLYKLGISKNVTEIFNRVNLELFSQIKTDFKIKNNSINLVSVGRFVKEKNYENLIKYLSNSKFKYHLTLIGGGELKMNYINVIQDLNQQENVTLIDWIDQKDFINIIVNCDIYIQSSVSEGMPRTIIEAMSLQMPIISTKVGSIEGVVENEVNGLLVSTKENEIVGAILKLYNSESLRSELAHKARKDVIEKYEWNSIFDIYRKEILNMQIL
jgi:glycosyltransferase involved in cell wall biosynthesis